MQSWVYNLVVYYLEKGGCINLLIFASCAAIIFIATGRWWYYRTIRKSLPSVESFREILHNRDTISKLPSWMSLTFSNWHDLPEELRQNRRTFINRYREMLLRQVPLLDKEMAMMGSLVTIAPLLGLLGTVVGMVKTFSVITLYGIGNPNLLSEGISVSLITTQTGLLVAFPGLLLHNWLSGQKEQLISSLIYLGERTMNGETNV